MTPADDFDAEIEDMDSAGTDDGDNPPRKKSGGVFMGILLVLIALGGGFFVVNSLGLLSVFGAGTPSPVVAPVAQQATEMPAPAAITALDSPVATHEMPGVEIPGAPVPASPAADIAVIPALSPLTVEAEEPMPAEPLTSVADAASAPIAAPVVSDPSEDMLSWDGSAGAVPQEEENIPAETVVAAPVQQDLTQTQALTQSIVPDETLAASSASAASEASPALPDAGAVAVQARMDALEQKLSIIQQNLDTLNESMPDKADIHSLKQAITRLEAEKGAAPLTAPAAEDTEVREKPAPVKKKKASVPAVKKTSAWVLKSAKPGEAWIAQKDGSGLKVIAVGDMVSGIGHVTDISQDSAGRWFVKGSSGMINQ